MEANVFLHSGSNVFHISARFVELWEVAKVQRDVLAVVHNFAAENVTGAGHAFTNAIKMIKGNDLESFIACEIGAIKAKLDSIVPWGWWLKDY